MTIPSSSNKGLNINSDEVGLFFYFDLTHEIPFPGISVLYKLSTLSEKFSNSEEILVLFIFMSVSGLFILNTSSLLLMEL